jgi:hypothetical protein
MVQRSDKPSLRCNPHSGRSRAAVQSNRIVGGVLSRPLATRCSDSTPPTILLIIARLTVFSNSPSKNALSGGLHAKPTCADRWPRAMITSVYYTQVYIPSASQALALSPPGAPQYSRYIRRPRGSRFGYYRTRTRTASGMPLGNQRPRGGLPPQRMGACCWALHFKVWGRQTNIPACRCGSSPAGPQQFVVARTPPSGYVGAYVAACGRVRIPA